MKRSLKPGRKIEIGSDTTVEIVAVDRGAVEVVILSSQRVRIPPQSKKAPESVLDCQTGSNK